MAKGDLAIEARIGVFIGGEEIDAVFGSSDKYLYIRFEEPITIRRGDELRIEAIVTVVSKVE